MSTPEAALTAYKQKLANNRLGLWLFLLSDSFVFAALLVTRFTCWETNAPIWNRNSA